MKKFDIPNQGRNNHVILIQSLYDFKWDMIVKTTYLWTIAISDIPK